MMPIIAITTNISISVKPVCKFAYIFFLMMKSTIPALFSDCEAITDKRYFMRDKRRLINQTDR